jgi:hypothetical protein
LRSSAIESHVSVTRLRAGAGKRRGLIRTGWRTVLIGGEADFRASRWLVVDREGGVLVFEEAFRDRRAEPGSAVGAAGCWGSVDHGA